MNEILKKINDNLLLVLGFTFLLIIILINFYLQKFHFIQIYGVFGILLGAFFLNRFYNYSIKYIPFAEYLFVIYLTYYFLLSFFLYEVHPVYSDVSITDLYNAINIFLIFAFIFSIYLFFQKEFFKNEIKKYNFSLLNTSKFVDIIVILLGTVLFITNRSNILICNDYQFINNNIQIIVHTISYFGSFICLFGIFSLYLKLRNKFFTSLLILYLIFYCLISVSNSGSANFAILVFMLLSIFYTIKNKKVPIIIFLCVPLVLSILSVKDIVRIQLDPGPKVQCTNFLNSSKILGKSYLSFLTEHVEYRDDKNNLVKRTFFTKDTTLSERLYYSVFRIFERLDNSYLFAQTIKKIPKEVNFFENDSYRWNSDKEWKLHYAKKIGVIHPSQTGSAFNFPILIESYANNGLVGVFLFSIIFSLLLFSFNYLIVKIDNETFKVLLIVSMSHFFFIENRFIFSSKQSLYTCISIILIFICIKVLESILKKFIKI
jgi:hypothetical protein